MKKKVLIFSCHGGGGHISAAQAIKSFLAEYETKVVDAIGNVLVSIDPIYQITFKRYCGQDVYNFLLRHNKKRLLNLLFYIGGFLFKLKKKLIYTILLYCIKKEKPDLIISVVPFINSALAQVAQEYNIPYLLIPTDFDVHAFLKEMTVPNYPLFKIGLSFDYPEIQRKLQQASIPPSCIKIIGFPIRASFFERKDIPNLKGKFNVSPHKKVIMIVMGAVGSTALLKYISVITSLNVPIHLIICIGRSLHLRFFINDLTLPEHMSLTIIDHLVDISDVMAIADVCITKPGSVTFAETLYMNLPVILDNTSHALVWEAFNLDFVTTYGLGATIKNYKQLKALTHQYLTDEQLLDQIKENMSLLKKKHFGAELIQLVDELLGHASTTKSIVSDTKIMEV